jgi:cytochrome c oxidase subunit III
LIRDRYFSPTVYQLGVGIAIVSILIFFAGLVVAYAFRIEAEQSWRRFSVPAVLWASTAVLIASSLFFEGARRNLRRAQVKAYRRLLAATIASACAFLATQLAAAVQLFDHGIGAAGNPHGSAFYLFIGLHGLHLAGGLVWLTVLRVKAGKLFGATESDLRQHRRLAQSAAMYWHFMGVLWVVLFCFLLRWTRG